jgi:hypothetical protein
MGHYFGAKEDATTSTNPPADEETGGPSQQAAAPEDDDNIRFTLATGGPRLRRDEFIQQLSKMDTRTRAKAIEEQAVPTQTKREVSRRASNANPLQRRPSTAPADSRRQSTDSLSHVKTTETIPSHAVGDSLAHFSFDRGGRETAAQRRRRNAPEPKRQTTSRAPDSESDADDEGLRSTGKAAAPSASHAPRPKMPRSSSATGSRAAQPSYFEEAETAVERNRRQAALGLTQEENSSDEEEARPAATKEPTRTSQGVRFTEETSPSGASGMRLRWGEDVGRKP